MHKRINQNDYFLSSSFFDLSCSLLHAVLACTIHVCTIINTFLIIFQVLLVLTRTAATLAGRSETRRCQKSDQDPDHTISWCAAAGQIARVPASGDPGPGISSVRVPMKHYTTGRVHCCLGRDTPRGGQSVVVFG